LTGFFYEGFRGPWPPLHNFRSPFLPLPHGAIGPVPPHGGWCCLFGPLFRPRIFYSAPPRAVFSFWYSPGKPSSRENPVPTHKPPFHLSASFFWPLQSPPVENYFFQKSGFVSSRSSIAQLEYLTFPTPGGEFLAGSLVRQRLYHPPPFSSTLMEVFTHFRLGCYPGSSTFFFLAPRCLILIERECDSRRHLGRCLPALAPFFRVGRIPLRLPSFPLTSVQDLFFLKAVKLAKRLASQVPDRLLTLFRIETKMPLRLVPWNHVEGP